MDADSLFDDVNEFDPTPDTGSFFHRFDGGENANDEPEFDFDSYETLGGEVWKELAASRVKKRQRGPGKKIIVDRDDRQLVPDISKPPFSGICFLQLTSPKGNTFGGTGWLVSPRVVISAGHCVYDTWDGEGLGMAKSITAHFGCSGDSSAFRVEASGATFDRGKWVPTDEPKCREFDFCAIQLAHPVDTSRFVPFTFGNTGSSDLSRIRVNIAGYPVASTESRTLPRRMYFHDGIIVESMQQKLGYRIDTTGGQSGAPLVFFDGTRNIVLGIHNSGSHANQMNYAARINQTVFDLLSAWKADLS